MASINHNRVPVVLFRLIITALLLFTASSPQAHAQFLGGLVPRIPLTVPPVSDLPPLIPRQLPAGLNVSGPLCCTINGNWPVQGGGQCVGGVPVILNCSFPTGTIAVGGGTTGVTGTFSIISFLPVVVQFLSTFFSTGGQLPFAIIMDQLTLNCAACPWISTLNATLVSWVNVPGTTTNGLLQTIVNANITEFFSVPV